MQKQIYIECSYDYRETETATDTEKETETSLCYENTKIG